MTNLLIVLAVIVAAIFALAVSRGWFKRPVATKAPYRRSASQDRNRMDVLRKQAADKANGV